MEAISGITLMAVIVAMAAEDLGPWASAAVIQTNYFSSKQWEQNNVSLYLTRHKLKLFSSDFYSASLQLDSAMQRDLARSTFVASSRNNPDWGVHKDVFVGASPPVLGGLDISNFFGRLLEQVLTLFPMHKVLCFRFSVVMWSYLSPARFPYHECVRFQELVRKFRS